MKSTVTITGFLYINYVNVNDFVRAGRAAVNMMIMLKMF